MSERMQINSNDGSYGDLSNSGHSKDGQIKTGRSWFGKKIKLTNPSNPDTLATQTFNRGSLINFLKNKPGCEHLKKGNLFKKGSSNDEIQQAFNHYVTQLTENKEVPPTPTLPKAPLRISNEVEQGAINALLENMSDDRAIGEGSLALIKQYLGGLEKETLREREYVILPDEMISPISVLLVSHALRSKEGIEPSKTWIRDQFYDPNPLRNTNFNKDYTKIRDSDARQIIDESYKLLNEQRSKVS